jgi:hypothetical protein
MGLLSHPQPLSDVLYESLDICASFLECNRSLEEPRIYIGLVIAAPSLFIVVRENNGTDHSQAILTEMKRNLVLDDTKFT